MCTTTTPPCTTPQSYTEGGEEASKRASERAMAARADKLAARTVPLSSCLHTSRTIAQYTQYSKIIIFLIPLAPLGEAAILHRLHGIILDSTVYDSTLSGSSLMLDVGCWVSGVGSWALAPSRLLLLCSCFAPAFSCLLLPALPCAVMSLLPGRACPACASRPASALAGSLLPLPGPGAQLLVWAKRRARSNLASSTRFAHEGLRNTDSQFAHLDF